VNIVEQARLAKEASLRLASAPLEQKNRALSRAAELIRQNRGIILAENGKDLKQAKKGKLTESLYKRLILNDRKIDQLVAGIEGVIGLPDPVGRVQLERELDQDLILTRVSVPIGVIGVIFESRPDALVQVSSLCLKSGNAAILKGGSEALYSNRILFELLRRAAEETDIRFKGSLQLVETREDIRELLKLDQYIDLMIPRGSNELVKSIQENTRIAVLGHTEGVCHLYIDREADPEMAVDIAYDAKCQYPAVCNSIETLLVHGELAAVVLPLLAEKLNMVELRGDQRCRQLIKAEAVSEIDWHTEYNDLILAIRVVDSFEEAVSHINTYGSRHTDGIITGNRDRANEFMERVDSASVMWNCSTRFADGFRYGLGAEVGISTNKIHARGPVGLEGLTIYKFKLAGRGHLVADYVEGKKKFSHRGGQ